jgi:uncharacterized repeat protein (TIGR03803 family)
MKPTVDVLNKLNWKRACAVLALCTTTAIALPAQTLTTLFHFDGTDGAQPVWGLVQATNGDLYGTTNSGGANGGGTIFKITPTGTLTTLYNFCSLPNCTDGDAPNALIQATDGNFYGTTGLSSISAINDGTIFKMSPSGVLTTLYSFAGTVGAFPAAPLVQAANGDFYGTTFSGGVNAGGTIFKITPTGTLTTLYSFCRECTDGTTPGTLVQAANGDFYGTTGAGGAIGGYCRDFEGCGTVFKITPTGTLTTLYRFCETYCRGYAPGALVQAANGDFYGTTLGAGGIEGTVFKITPSGTLTTLYEFCSQGSYLNCPDGAEPTSPLVQAANGDFYGTTSAGGANGWYGTIFKITPGGTLTTLYSFCAQSGCPDGFGPIAGLVQDTNGDFYGTTGGGDFNNSTVFRLSVGLGPFVEGRPVSGEVGTAVEILGTDLMGATSVSFNGAAATFTVASRYVITTTVPAGASTGPIQVVTPSRTLSSNGSFRVLP